MLGRAGKSELQFLKKMDGSVLLGKTMLHSSIINI